MKNENLKWEKYYLNATKGNPEYQKLNHDEYLALFEWIEGEIIALRTKRNEPTMKAYAAWTDAMEMEYAEKIRNLDFKIEQHSVILEAMREYYFEFMEDSVPIKRVIGNLNILFLWYTLKSLGINPDNHEFLTKDKFAEILVMLNGKRTDNIRNTYEYTQTHGIPNILNYTRTEKLHKELIDWFNAKGWDKASAIVEQDLKTLVKKPTNI